MSELGQVPVIPKDEIFLISRERGKIGAPTIGAVVIVNVSQIDELIDLLKKAKKALSNEKGIT